MINPSEISSLISAVSQNDLGLRGEILQILRDSKIPLCCKEIFDLSKCAADMNECSREVHQMTSIHKLLEVAERKPRDGFREVSFYQLSARGRDRAPTTSTNLPPPAQPRGAWPQVGESSKLQPNTAKVKPAASIIPTHKERSMPSTRTGSMSTDIHEFIVNFPGATREEVIKFAKTLFPDTTEDKIKSTIGNLITREAIRAEGIRGDRKYFSIAPKGTPKAKEAPPPQTRCATGFQDQIRQQAHSKGQARSACACSPQVRRRLRPGIQLRLRRTQGWRRGDLQRRHLGRACSA